MYILFLLYKQAGNDWLRVMKEFDFLGLSPTVHPQSEAIRGKIDDKTWMDFEYFSMPEREEGGKRLFGSVRIPSQEPKDEPRHRFCGYPEAWGRFTRTGVLTAYKRRITEENGERFDAVWYYRI